MGNMQQKFGDIWLCGFCKWTNKQSQTDTYTTVIRPSWILSGTTLVSRHQKGKTRKVKPIWIYWRKRQWVAVASAGHMQICTLTRHITTPASHHSNQTKSVKALKARQTGRSRAIHRRQKHNIWYLLSLGDHEVASGQLDCIAWWWEKWLQAGYSYENAPLCVLLHRSRSTADDEHVVFLIDRHATWIAANVPPLYVRCVTCSVGTNGLGRLFE